MLPFIVVVKKATLFCHFNPVYLRADLKTLKDRIKKRGRSEEAHIEPGFLEGLQEYHENWLFYQVTPSETFSFKWSSINDVTTNWEGVKCVVTISV